MVSVKIVSRYAENFPERVDGFRRRIAGGPLYSAEEVKRILSAHGVAGVSAWTRECSSDLQKLEIDGMGLVELLRQALSSGRYLGSEWCQQRPDGPWAACDAYRLDRREWLPVAGKHLSVEYYLKFAIARPGNLLLIVSCHLSR